MGQASRKKRIVQPVNMQEARERAAAERPPRPTEEPSPQEGIPFALEELFAAYGSKEFENQKLRGQIATKDQQIKSLLNHIREMEIEQATQAPTS